MNQGYALDSMDQFHTPMKELPPSFGYGSSSSPYHESSPVRDQYFQEWTPSLQHSLQVPQQIHRQMMSRHMSLDMAHEVSNPLVRPLSNTDTAQQLEKTNLKSNSFHQLLPSQFPPEFNNLSYGNLASSPPVPTMARNQRENIDKSGSPQPRALRNKQQHQPRRGRPRKYSVPETTALPQRNAPPAYMNGSSAVNSNHSPATSPLMCIPNIPNSTLPVSMASSCQSQSTVSHRKRQRTTPDSPDVLDSTPLHQREAGPQHIGEEMHTPPMSLEQPLSERKKRKKRQSLPKGEVGKSKELPLVERLERLPKENRLAEHSDSYERRSITFIGQRVLDTSDITPDRKLSIYTDAPTSNGIPLISARAFRLACDLQGARKRANLREFFSDYKQQEKRHFSTNGLGFNFTIDTSGTASIDRMQATPNSPHGPQRDEKQKLGSDKLETPRIIDVLDEDSDSDSEAEHETANSSYSSEQVRTPPRFSSLGSSDAATEFARTYGRSHDRGFMFLFPNESTPDKPVHLSSNHPCTPRTPRIPIPFDEDSFSLQMQTPPGAVFSSYDYQAGNYVTGMTPYINGLDRIGVNE